MSESDSTDFMHHVCKSAGGFRLLFTISISISVLMLIWIPFTDLNTGTGAIVGMNLLLGVLFSSFFGGMLLVCRRRATGSEPVEAAD